MIGFVDDPGHGVGFRIEKVWAYVAVHDDGDEGLVGVPLPGYGTMPAIAADPERLEQLRKLVEPLPKATGKTIRLKRFERVVTVEELQP